MSGVQERNNCPTNIFIDTILFTFLYGIEKFNCTKHVFSRCYLMNDTHKNRFVLAIFAIDFLPFLLCRILSPLVFHNKPVRCCIFEYFGFQIRNASSDPKETNFNICINCSLLAHQTYTFIFLFERLKCQRTR